MEALVGVSAQAALGQPCYTSIHGVDALGRLHCREECSAFQAIRSGRFSAGYTLTIPNGEAKRFRCDLHALPRQSGALVRLIPQNAGGSTNVPDEAHGAPRSTSNVIDDLSALAAITTALSPGNLSENLEMALDVLREATGADSAELFLAEPIGHDMLLTAYRGPFRHAFLQRVRFAPGEGFPGLVMTGGQAVLTETLGEDTRYLRHDVSKKGYQTCICVPLHGSQSVLGAIAIAFRRSDVALDDVLRLLNWASVPFAMAMEASVLQAIRTVTPGDIAFRGNDGDLDVLLHDVLTRTRQLAEADSGRLVLLNRHTNGVIRHVADGSAEQQICPGACHNGLLVDCPAIEGGHGVALSGSRQEWPNQCRHLRRNASATYCLPLQSGGENIGLIQLDYHDHVPSPPTRHLAMLLEVAGQAATMLSIGRQHLEHDHRVELATVGSLPDPAKVSMNGASAGGDRAKAESRSADKEGHGDAPLLHIRCFGVFEIQREGTLIAPHQFKRRKALELLKILLIHAGKPVKNETLIEYLWPESEPDAGLNRLHVVVHALRRAIEPHGSAGQPECILSDREHYTFADSPLVWLDLAEFATACTKGREAEERGDLLRAIEAYDQATRLYRGDLLEDEPFAEWCYLEREYQREVYLGTLQRLADLSARTDNPDRAIGAYLQILHNDPLRESTVRHLMECMWQNGRRSEALRQYELFRQNLQRELEMTPLPETELLAGRLRAAI